MKKLTPRCNLRKATQSKKLSKSKSVEITSILVITKKKKIQKEVMHPQLIKDKLLKAKSEF